MNDETDNIIKSECDQIKEQIKPSDELINKTILKVRKVQEERTYKKLKTQKLLTKVLGTFTAIVIVAEGASFAFKKQDILSILFSKVDKGIETAIEYGNIKNVEMDYIEIKDGLKMKAEFVLMNEYNFDLVFKFDGLEEYCKANGIDKIEKIEIPDLSVVDNNGNLISSTLQFVSSPPISNINTCTSFSYNNSIYTFLHCYSYKHEFPINTITDVNIIASQININKNHIENLNNTINLNINNFNIDKEQIKYTIKNCPDYIEKYDITLSSTNLNVKLYLKNNISSINKDNFSLKNSFKSTYLPNDDFIFTDDYLIVVFPISNYEEINDLKLILDLNNKTERLHLEKQG